MKNYRKNRMRTRKSSKKNQTRKIIIKGNNKKRMRRVISSKPKKNKKKRRNSRKKMMGGDGDNDAVAQILVGGVKHLCILDPKKEDMNPAYDIFKNIHKIEAGEDGCRESMPTPSGAVPEIVSGKFFNTSFNFYDISSDRNSEVMPILEYTCSLFNKYLDIDCEVKSDAVNGITVNGEKPMVEAHRYAAHNACIPVKSPFAWHQDDGGALDFSTYTAIYYLYKTSDDPENKFLGGNFLCAFPEEGIYIVQTEGDTDALKKTDEKILYDMPNGTQKNLDEYQVTTKTGRVVLMRGDVVHVPGSIQKLCHGCRDSVVVQFKRLEQ